MSQKTRPPNDISKNDLLPSKDHHTLSSDVIIIGAGPVGLFAVFACGMLNMRSIVIDSLPAIGGQLQALYPEKPIYDIAGFPSILAGDLISNLKKQAQPFKPHYLLDEQVVDLTPLFHSKGQKDAQGWSLTTNLKRALQTKILIIAAGAGSFSPNRPPLKDITSYEGKSVHYVVRERAFFKDKTIMIAGGGDSAIDWALSLATIAKKVFLVHRRAKFRAAPASLGMLETYRQSGRVELVTPYQLHQLHGDNGRLKAVSLRDFDQNIKRIECEHLLAFFGLKSELGVINDWGLEVERKLILVDHASMQTNLKGIYAIGDVAHYAGKLKLIAQGFGEALTCAHHAWHLLHQDQALHFEHSTSRGVGFK
ncbi:MAG: NAD(P)/FAD-dependent oxidoreductase [Pseudomonadota bacterium]